MQQPHWSHSVAVFDLETTGVDVANDRIVTAHVGLLGPDGEIVRAASWLADPGMEIPAAATAVHGISTRVAREQGSGSGAVVAGVVTALEEMFAAGIPVVAFNAAFDFTLLHHEALRHDVAAIAEPLPIIDPLVLDRALDRYRRGKRTLELVATHYGVDLIGAHDAAADAIAAGHVAQAIARRYELPADARDLHAQQIVWARTQAESLTEYLRTVGRIPAHEIVDGAWPLRLPVSVL